MLNNQRIPFKVRLNLADFRSIHKDNSNHKKVERNPSQASFKKPKNSKGGYDRAEIVDPDTSYSRILADLSISKLSNNTPNIFETGNSNSKKTKENEPIFTYSAKLTESELKKKKTKVFDDKPTSRNPSNSRKGSKSTEIQKLPKTKKSHSKDHLSAKDNKNQPLIVNLFSRSQRKPKIPKRDKSQPADKRESIEQVSFNLTEENKSAIADPNSTNPAQINYCNGEPITMRNFGNKDLMQYTHTDFKESAGQLTITQRFLPTEEKGRAKKPAAKMQVEPIRAFVGDSGAGKVPFELDHSEIEIINLADNQEDGRFDRTIRFGQDWNHKLFEIQESKSGIEEDLNFNSKGTVENLRILMKNKSRQNNCANKNSMWSSGHHHNRQVSPSLTNLRTSYMTRSSLNQASKGAFSRRPESVVDKENRPRFSNIDYNAKKCQRPEMKVLSSTPCPLIKEHTGFDVEQIGEEYRLNQDVIEYSYNVLDMMKSVKQTIKSLKGGGCQERGISMRESGFSSAGTRSQGLGSLSGMRSVASSSRMLKGYEVARFKAQNVKSRLESQFKIKLDR